MISKEALENLVHCKQELKCKECKHKSRCTMERDYNIINKDLDRLEKLEKIIHDYCYIDNFDEGEIVRMCCESYEESNSKDFVFLKGVLEND